MTSRRISTTGEGSEAHGLCEPPQRPERFVQGVSVPVSCFKVEIVVHQRSGTDFYCHSMQVSDPHTRELLAHVVNPTARALQALGMVSSVTLDLRAVLLELTDPEPF